MNKQPATSNKDFILETDNLDFLKWKEQNKTESYGSNRGTANEYTFSPQQTSNAPSHKGYRENRVNYRN